MEKIYLVLLIVMLVFGILQIVLFFKMWGMTNNVRKLTLHFCESKDSEAMGKKIIDDLSKDEVHDSSGMNAEGIWCKDVTDEEKKRVASFIDRTKKGECIILTSDDVKIIDMDNLSDLQVDYKIIYYK